jgi:hypothetical protein
VQLELRILNQEDKVVQKGSITLLMASRPESDTPSE